MHETRKQLKRLQFLVSIVGFSSLLVCLNLTRKESPRWLAPDIPRQITWLISYDKSHDEWLVETIERLSQATTAVNDGRAEHNLQNGESVPAAGTHVGPFRNNPTLPLPPRYIITRTDCQLKTCDGGCDRITQSTDNQLTDFAKQCTTTYFKMGGPREFTSNYWVGHVYKVIVSVRDPYDVVVGRFFDAHAQNAATDTPFSRRFVKRYPKSPEGFQKWCIDKNPSQAFCHDEINQYVKFLNDVVSMATQVLNDGKGVQILFVDYKDWIRDTPGTLRNIFEFTKLSPNVDFDIPFGSNQPFAFNFSGGYRTTYYNAEQVQLISDYIETICLGEVCAHLDEHLV